MARCDLQHNSFVTGFTVLPPLGEYDTSPDSSATMGSVSSLVGDSGYRGGSSCISDTASSEGQSIYYEEQQQQWGPPRIMPVSGKLEKNKEKRLIRPIAVKPSSPSESPASTSSKPSLSDSPGMLDDIPEMTQPDVVLTNQMRRNHYNESAHYRGSGRKSSRNDHADTKHFGAPPTKAQSLQDISTPTHQNYQVHFNEPPTRDYDSRGHYNKLQPSQSMSMNHLDHSWNDNGYTDEGRYQNQDYYYNPRLEKDHRRRPYSQSITVLDSGHGSSNRHEAQRIHGQHSMSSNHLLDLKVHHHHERSSSGSHVSSVLEEIEDEEIIALREKIKEQGSELAMLRDTMEKNEATIFEVYEDKQRRWEDEIARLRKELQEQDDGSRKTRVSLQGQIYKLEQERKALQSKVDQMHQEKENKKNLDANQNDRNFVRPSKSSSRERIHELGKTPKDQRQFQSNGLKRQSTKMVASSEMDLRSVLSTRHMNGHAKHGSIEQILQERDAELNQAQVEIGHIRVIKENLSQQVKVQEEELKLLRKKLDDKEQELSQEKCEIEYLRDVQDKLNRELVAKQREARMASQNGGKNKDSSSLAQLAQIQDKLAQKHRELTHMAERLKQMQAERDSDKSGLRLKLKERDEEVRKLQNKVRFLEKERGRGAGKSSKLTPAQRQLESDFMDMQVKLTRKERELFKAKQDLLSIQEKGKFDNDALKSRLKQREDEQRTCLEELKKREAEMSRMMERLDERKEESEKLNAEIERLKRQGHQKYSKSSHVQELENQVKAISDENEMLKREMEDIKDDNSLLTEKLGRISLGVRNLSSSQLNLLGGATSPVEGSSKPMSPPPVAKQNALISKAIASSTTITKPKLVNGSAASKTTGPVKANAPMNAESHITLTGSLRREIGSLKKELNAMKQKSKDQEHRYCHERKKWHDEKEKVIAYQKQLQLNYVQMCQRNKNLEQEVQQLTIDLEQVHKEISHC